MFFDCCSILFQNSVYYVSDIKHCFMDSWKQWCCSIHYHFDSVGSVAWCVSTTHVHRSLLRIQERGKKGFSSYEGSYIVFRLTDFYLINKATIFRCYLRRYGNCPRIFNTKWSDKMAFANSADPDQTAPEGAV